MKYFIVMIAALILMACGEEKKPLPQDFNRSGEVQAITVHVYPDEKSMQKARKSHDGMNDPAHLGWATWTKARPLKCDLHVVRIRDPTDNQGFVTWGHELTHCIYGNFHQ